MPWTPELWDAFFAGFRDVAAELRKTAAAYTAGANHLETTAHRYATGQGIATADIERVGHLVKTANEAAVTLATMTQAIAAIAQQAQGKPTPQA